MGWLYLVDAVLWGPITISAIFPWLGAAFISAHRKIESPNSSPASPGSPISHDPAEGDTVRITVTLESPEFWPSYLLNVYYNCPAAPPESRLHRFLVSNVFRSGQVSGQISMESTVDAYQRGLHYLGPVVVESSAPFGLFWRRRNVTREQPVLVYPQVYPLRRLAMAQGFSGMESEGRKARTGTDLLGTRRYAPGDPRRNIHWRNSAKTGELMVKELEDPLDRTTYLLFDATRVWGEGRETTLEYGIKVVASVASFAHRSHLPVQVLGGGLSGKASHAGEAPQKAPVEAPVGSPGESLNKGRTTWPGLLNELALVNPGDGLDMAENPTKLPPGASAVAVISSSDRVTLQALARASSTLQSVVLISLEGFVGKETEQEMHADDLKSLLAAKIPVIPCRPGELKGALDALGSGKGQTSGYLSGGKDQSFTSSGPTPTRTMTANGRIGNGRYHG